MQTSPPEFVPAPQLGSSTRIARILHGLASLSQLGVLIALFVLWQERGWPFLKALEICVVGGVAVYTVLHTVAAIVLLIARLLSPAVLIGYASRLVLVTIYGVLRYQRSENIITSGVILAVLYAASWYVVRKMERKARSRFGL